LDSIRGQRYDNWECLVIDDGSTDQTADIVQSLSIKDARFIYYYQKNAGLSSARNAGLTLANGEFIQFLDADDLIEPEKIRRQVESFQRNRQAGLVYSGVRYFSDSPYQNLRLSLNSDDNDWMPKVSGNGDDLLLSLIQQNIMAVSSPLVRRDLISTVGLFDLNLSMFADWDYWLRCAITGTQFVYDDADGIRSLIRYHLGSMTHHSPTSARERERIRRKISKMNLSPSIRAINDHYLANSLVACGGEKIREGEVKTGLAKLFEAYKYDRYQVCKTLYAGIMRRGKRYSKSLFLRPSN